MRKFIYLLLIVVALVFFFFVKTKVDANVLPLLGKVIFVDPGHGGRDPGTTFGNIHEKKINLEISKALEKELSANGAYVILTRYDDSDLSSIYDIRKKRGDLYRRIKKIDDYSGKADMYLSIHINWYNNSYWSGAEVLYNDSNNENINIAKSIMNEFKTVLSTKRTVKTTNLYMYKYIKTPGVLIECGFLSNYRERQLLQDSKYQEKIAKTITTGVINYYKDKED